MEEVYNTMVLCIYYLVAENTTFPLFKWLSPGACNSSIMFSLGLFLRDYS
jgi:uncharacterized BrkB/YihY/UPF0761 family membrane protein